MSSKKESGAKKILAANWKMHKTPKQAQDFFIQWKQNFSEDSGRIDPSLEWVFFPPALCLQGVIEHLQGMARHGCGLQNAWKLGAGAFTGENSAQAAKEMGANWVLLGHSERRSLFDEGDELIFQKVSFCRELGLKVILCIGENERERDAGNTLQVLERQLKSALQGLSKTDSSFCIAYEPVWAIGTGKVASEVQIREAHLFVKGMLDEMGFSGDSISVLYGGSVKPENAQAIGSIAGVDGFLVGGASLEVKSLWTLSQMLAIVSH